jgi:hypothetical protein
METSLAFKTKTNRWWRKKYSANKSQIITPIFFRYNNITLKLFLEIAENSDYKKVLVSGDASEEQCVEQFEKIVEQHNYHNGNQEHLNYIAHQKSYRDLLQKYNTIRSSLLYLTGAIDNRVIEFLNSQGYKIDVSSQAAFDKTFLAAWNKSNNLNSKLKQKLNQLANFNEALISKQQAYNAQSSGLEERLASLSFALGFSCDEEITLARYNEYVKIINKQQAHGTGAKRHNNG